MAYPALTWPKAIEETNGKVMFVLNYELLLFSKSDAWCIVAL